MRLIDRRALMAAIAVTFLQLACNAHAMPATGRDRGPFAGPHPEYPEINCDLYSTIDCRPPVGQGP